MGLGSRTRCTTVTPKMWLSAKAAVVLIRDHRFRPQCLIRIESTDARVPRQEAAPPRIGPKMSGSAGFGEGEQPWCP